MSTPHADAILVIIPALNEEGAIRQVVTGIHTALPDADVLVIDDGSQDSTAVVARSAGALVVSHPFNLGIGGAVQTGLKFAQQHRYDYVIRMDGDGQHSAAAIDALLAPLRVRQADMVISTLYVFSETNRQMLREDSDRLK